MDYNYISEKVSKKTLYFVVKKFKEFYIEDLTFEFSIDSIRAYISAHNNKSIIFKNYELFKNAILKFNRRKSYFRSGDAITKIINTEIYKEFNDKIKTKILEDSNFDELNNYSFEKFSFDLVVYCTLEEIENRLGENSSLYRLFFESKNYKEFTFNHFEGKVEESELYEKLYKIAHPETKKDNKSNKVEESNFYIDPRFSLLNNDEKILLLHIIYNTFFKNTKTDNHPKLDLTDFARVIYLTKDCVDSNIFDKNYANRAFYKKLNNGIIYSESLETRNKLISSLLEKIEILNLKSLREHIESVKTTTIGNNKK